MFYLSVLLFIRTFKYKVPNLFNFIVFFCACILTSRLIVTLGHPNEKMATLFYNYICSLLLFLVSVHFCSCFMTKILWMTFISKFLSTKSMLCGKINLGQLCYAGSFSDNNSWTKHVFYMFFTLRAV